MKTEEVDANLKIDLNLKYLLTLIIKSEFLTTQESILDDIQSVTDNYFATVRKEKRKSVFAISVCLRKET